MKSFTATEFQRRPGETFNAVQADGEALISKGNRPAMVIMLQSEKDALIEKIQQLADLVKAKA